MQSCVTLHKNGPNIWLFIEISGTIRKCLKKDRTPGLGKVEGIHSYLASLTKMTFSLIFSSFHYFYAKKYQNGRKYSKLYFRSYKNTLLHLSKQKWQIKDLFFLPRGPNLLMSNGKIFIKKHASINFALLKAQLFKILTHPGKFDSPWLPPRGRDRSLDYTMSLKC